MTRPGQPPPRPRSQLRIALLRGDDHHNLYLERLLASRFDLVCVISEPGREQRLAIWRRKRWRDAAAAEYHRFRRVATGKNRYRRRYFDPTHDGFATVSSGNALSVRTINDERVAVAVSRSGAQICVISCTTRLSGTTIRDIGMPIINIHGGHLPDYRGCHCFFTALLERRFDAIGSTLHFVDDGLDTGDLIEVVKPQIRSSDDPETLYSRAERLAAQRLAELLANYEQGLEFPREKQAYRGRLVLRRHRTPIDDIGFWWARRSGRLVVPDIAGPVPQHPWEAAGP